MAPRLLLLLFTILGLWQQQASAEGCFWISRCQNLWIGGCGNGYVPVETSNDCQGLCAMPQYPTCPPFFTRFQCCTEGRARESSNSCNRCPNKAELGDGWICCSDCSEAFITDAKRKTGYCQTDAFLTYQPKPRELFKWNAGAWKNCRGNCKKASRKRDVKCLRYLEDAPQAPIVVKDDKCLSSTKPASQEKCTLQRCVNGSHQRRRLPVWAIVLISLTSAAAAGGLAFLGFILYKRRIDDCNHGFVYVMLDNY